MAVSQPVESLSIHVYRKRQTSDSSLEFLKIENEQIKTAQNNINVDKKLCETTILGEEINEQ